MAALPTDGTGPTPLSAVSWGWVNSFAGGKEAAAFSPKDLMAQCGRTSVTKGITSKGKTEREQELGCFCFFFLLYHWILTSL